MAPHGLFLRSMFLWPDEKFKLSSAVPCCIRGVCVGSFSHRVCVCVCEYVCGLIFPLYPGSGRVLAVASLCCRPLVQHCCQGLYQLLGSTSGWAHLLSFAPQKGAWCRV